jgi:hypothetical protein
MGVLNWVEDVRFANRLKNNHNMRILVGKRLYLYARVAVVRAGHICPLRRLRTVVHCYAYLCHWLPQSTNVVYAFAKSKVFASSSVRSRSPHKNVGCGNPLGQGPMGTCLPRSVACPTTACRHRSTPP